MSRGRSQRLHAGIRSAIAALANDLAFFRSRGLVADPKITPAALVDPSFAAAAVTTLGRIQTSMAEPH